MDRFFFIFISNVDFKENNLIADDEHIYASLPEEEEFEVEEDAKPSGSFSARSTLPDNCQLIAYQQDYCSENNALERMTNETNGRNVVNIKASEANNSVTNTTSNSPFHHSNSSNNSSSSSSTIGDNTEDIYEEVSNLVDMKFNELDHIKRRSGSQDTLIAISTNDISQLNGDISDDEEDNEEEEEDDDEDLDEDCISMISHASSSTFSSFTTCANQDFEFIVSQNQIGDDSLSSTKQQSVSHDGKSNGKSEAKSTNVELEPSTLSLAAMYYNRFILNEGGANAKSGHRQRPKINRRQSFSTAYELRQRILHNQLNRQLDDDNKMNLIEEECEDNGAIDGSNDNYHPYTAELEELLATRLNRRISTSEDNLLSIISTIVNCGDDTNDFDLNQIDGQQNIENNENKCEKTNQTKSEDEQDKSGTFLLKKDSNRVLGMKKLTAKQSQSSTAIPRATSNLPVPKSTKVGQQMNPATKISIKELKSKKQAAKISMPNSSKIQSRPVLNNNRVYELGSLWERSNGNGKFTPMYNPKSKLNADKSKLSKKSQSPTSSSSSSSTPTSPSRVPMFISVSPLRTPTQYPARKESASKYQSKLPEPSQYSVKQKQDARQNAILAKNALLLSGIKNDA